MTTMIAVEDVKRLKARYFRLLDTKQWSQWAEVFSHDCVMDVPEAGLVLEGREQIVSTISGFLEGARTVHHGHMPEIEVLGADTARGTWAMYDFVEFPGQEGAAPTALHGYGHYHEEYVRVDGQWRIARVRLERLRVDQT